MRGIAALLFAASARALAAQGLARYAGLGPIEPVDGEAGGAVALDLCRGSVRCSHRLAKQNKVCLSQS